MEKEISKIIKNYAHDFRDIAQNEADLEVMLSNFVGEITDIIIAYN
jgi:hypothetical protein